MPTGDLLRRALDAFLTKIRILPWDRNEASAYGQLRAKQERTGKLLGNLDMLIAAHAIAAGAILVTNNKAFAQVQDLEGIVNWATDLENAQL
jgi:tRNA(fMet)-specific endonuclease VapC